MEEQVAAAGQEKEQQVEEYQERLPLTRYHSAPAGGFVSSLMAQNLSNSSSDKSSKNNVGGEEQSLRCSQAAAAAAARAAAVYHGHGCPADAHRTTSYAGFQHHFHENHQQQHGHILEPQPDEMARTNMEQQQHRQELEGGAGNIDIMAAAAAGLVVGGSGGMYHHPDFAGSSGKQPELPRKRRSSPCSADELGFCDEDAAAGSLMTEALILSSQLSLSVPCKLRARRGCATHPRSVAERVRRSRISEGIKRLQELVPNTDRQTNTADMLNQALEYMKHLEEQNEQLKQENRRLKMELEQQSHND